MSIGSSPIVSKILLFKLFFLMKFLLKFTTSNQHYLELLLISINKQIVLLFKLFFYFILKSQLFFHSLFVFNDVRIFSLNKSFVQKIKRVFQVLKSPQVHKKAQEKFVLQKYNSKQLIQLFNICLNKLYFNIFFNLVFFVSVTHLYKYFLSTVLKLKYSRKFKLIV